MLNSSNPTARLIIICSKSLPLGSNSPEAKTKRRDEEKKHRRGGQNGERAENVEVSEQRVVDVPRSCLYCSHTSAAASTSCCCWYKGECASQHEDKHFIIAGKLQLFCRDSVSLCQEGHETCVKSVCVIVPSEKVAAKRH